ncbi:ATP-dependent helicase/deoxyribonuclease subunit B [Alloiococcus otitis]|uniref:Helicase-exonuclease AddAB, AddB subunit n=1 Tax=Alloiococcus otitis ATCC 51267 TaxID=883081 RepID=K9EDV5_9LACT|nr:PD-(D/E)XK nuclease family protein [Alloiococcus otitis]EKU94071.1 helicase-exonuclease AddAB, AddB subunit [Alloiococcus otitis ATCC 51267]SUU81015.1 ATP-dependent helicase/deoxyribonuclease subunit B [Alloiococcus otitis]
MGLHFKLGRNRLNQDQVRAQQLFDLVQQEDLDQVYYLIPDHLKFESEVNILDFFKEKSQAKAAGMIKVQVYSFTRLAWALLSDSAMVNRTRLSQTGLAVMVKKIMLELKQDKVDLLVYQGQEAYPGFISKLTDLLLEFRSGLIEAEDLTQIKDQLDQEGQSFRKLADLEKIYPKFLEELSQKYLDQEDILKTLVDYIKGHDFSQTVFVIDHYDSFSSQEMDLIKALLENAKDVYLYLNLDKAYPNNYPPLLDIFYQSGKTYQQVFQLAQTIPDLAIQTDYIDPSGYQVGIKPGILDLEDYWYRTYSQNQKGSPVQSSQLKDRVQITEVLTIQDEVHYLANKIKQFVASASYRYKDILVVGRDLSDYKNSLVPIFNQEGIPVFFDLTDSMSQHPLVEFLLAAIRIVLYNFQYPDVMRFLRSELYLPNDQEKTTSPKAWRAKVDQTENVLLAYGYQGPAWTRGEDWVYDRISRGREDQEQSLEEKRIQETSNQVRSQLHRLFDPLIKSLNQDHITNRQAMLAIYDFMEKCQVKDRILAWRDQALEAQDLDQSKRHEQAWHSLISLFDEYIEVMGDYPWDGEEFLAMIELAFESTEFSNVPPRLDQVTVTSRLDWDRTSRHPIVFYLGMNESNFPQAIDNQSILDDQDRQVFQDYLQENPLKNLRSSSEERLADEAYTAYKAFNLASQYLFFSYSQKQDGASDHSLSPYLKQVQQAFDLEIYQQGRLGDLIQDPHPKDLDQVLASKYQLANLTLLAFRLDREKQIPLHPLWAKLATYLAAQDQGQLRRIFSSLDFKNIPVPLGEKLAQDLYGKDLYLSVSQLETYYKDPYNHFLQYGLKLKDRDQLELTPAESGSYYHDILDQVISEVIASKQDLADIDPADLEDLAQDRARNLLEDPRYKVLSASNQMAFIRDQLLKNVNRRLKSTHKHFQSSHMRPYLTELNFGLGSSDTSLPAYEIPLSDQSTVYLRGKIDRVDLMSDPNRGEDHKYLQIVDYKSSKKSLKASELNAGLSLQLLTYFDTVLKYYDQLDLNLAGLKPLAALYSQIHMPKIMVDKLLNEADLNQKINKELKYQGLLLDEPKALDLLDVNLQDTNGYSDYYPYMKKKDGSFSIRRPNQLIKPADLELLLHHNRQLIAKAGQDILSGKLVMKPYYGVDHIDTVSGPYHAISQFDVLLAENQYQYLTTFDSMEDYLAHLQKLYQKDGGDHDPRH